jgi:catechol 2,3-dioxygenase-like lactoylglutathione lyase family enzyme
MKLKFYVLSVIALLSAQIACIGQADNQSPPGAIRVRYMVNDVNEAVAFYTNKLHFHVTAQSGSNFAIVARDNLQLVLSPPKGPGGASQPMPNGQRPAPGGWNRIILPSANLEADVDALKKAGVKFRNNIVTGPGGREILLEDPSGNPIELFEATRN